MKQWWVLAVAVVALGGCAAAGGAGRHAGAAATRAARPYALDAVVVAGPRAGALSASRMWERSAANRAVTAKDDDELRQAFVADLGRALPLDPSAPRRVRATFILQDTGYYEGLAAETTDVTLDAAIFDDDGHYLGSVILREAASAPLQRSTSRRDRLRAAFGRLARRLAARLEAA